MKKLFLLLTICALMLCICSCSSPFEKYQAAEGGSVVYSLQDGEISAVADNGYRFVAWSDGIEDSSREYNKKLKEAVTAEFEPICVVLRQDGKEDTKLTLIDLAEREALDDLMPTSSEGVYHSSYTSKEICERFGFNEDKDLLAQIKERYLSVGFSNIEDLVLDARYIFYSAQEGGSVSKTESGFLAIPDNGYRFLEWSDNNASDVRNDDFSSGDSFEAIFELINVNMYVEDELFKSVAINEFVELTKEDITTSLRGKIFQGWALSSTLELFNNNEDIIAQIKNCYAEGNIKGVEDISISAVFTDKKAKDFYQFKTIAHALGGAPWLDEENNTYLNSVEVFNLHYSLGQRFFEIDLLLTADGKIVAAHEYESTILYDDFMATDREGFTPIDLELLIDMMIEYPEIRMDLDILSVYRSGYNGTAEEKLTLFYNLLDEEIRKRAVENEELYDDIYERLVLEIFFEEPLSSLMLDLAKSESYGFKHFMFSGVGDKETPMGTSLEDLEAVCQWCAENGIDMMSTKIVDEEFIAMTDRYDIFTFAYTYNTETQILDLLEIGVDCVFTDFIYLD